MRKTVRNIQQVPRDENPVGPEVRDYSERVIVSWKVSIDVQVCEMNRPSSGQGGMSAVDA